MNSTRGSNEIRAGSTYRCLNDYHHLSLVTFRVTNKLNLFRGFWVAKPTKPFVLESSSFKVTVQFSCSVLSDSLWPHGLQHDRPPCPLPTPRVYSNSCPLSRWSHPTVSSSVVPFSSCLQSFPAFFKWVSSLHQVAKVLEFQLQHQSFQWIFRTDFL